MIWTIAVLTTPERKTQLERILGVLEHQIADRKNIEILVASQDGSIAEKRQWCLNNAQGKYFNFIDDDDLIAHDYIDSILPLLDGVDAVGFNIQHYLDGHLLSITPCSLRYKTWASNGQPIAHINPVRTEVARQGSFVSGPGEEFSEDVRWGYQINPQTEHFIDRPMYFYFDDRGD